MLGSSSAWLDLLEQMLPEILQLTIDTWNALERPFADVREDQITTILCRALRKNRTARELPFYVQIQMVELDPVPGEELGRLDIAFLPTGVEGGPNEGIYFCLECKRLNVCSGGRRRSGGSEYVLHGMIRFINGQYANTVRHGGMLGYVLNGDIPSAIASIESNVRSHHVVLGMDPPGTLQASSIVPAVQTARESHHRRASRVASFRIHHLFVGG